MTVRGPYGFTSGLNTRAGAYDTPDAAYNTGTDIEVEYNHLIPRLSYANWSSGTHPGAGFTKLGFWLGTAVVGVGGGKIATTPVTPGSAWTDITGAQAPSGNNVSFAILNNIMVITDGVNLLPAKWTGSGNAANLGGSPPANALGCAMANNFMFLGGTPTNPSRVQWSAVNDPETWPSANFIDFRKKDGDSVTAIYPFGEDLVIFKNYSMGRLYTTVNTGINNALGPLVTISEKIGCVGVNCVDRLPDGRLVFMGADTHAYIYDGSQITDISDTAPNQSNIQPTLDGTTFRATGFLCVKVYKKKHQVWFCNPFSGVSAGNFIYDYMIGAWISNHNTPLLYSLVNTVNLTTGIEYLVGGTSSGNVYQMDTGTSAVYTTLPVCARNIPISAGGREFIPRSIFIPIETTGSTSGSVSWFYDTSSTTFSKTFSYSTSGSQRLIVPITRQQNASYININISFTSQANPWKLFPYYLSDEVLI